MLWSRTKRNIIEHRPGIETATGISLLITGSVVALFEGPKIQEDIRMKKEELGKDKLNPIEIAQCTWKHITPVLLLDIAGASSVIDGLKTEHKRAVGLATAAGIAEETLRLTQQKEREIVGPSKADDIQHAVAETEVDAVWKRLSTIYETGHGNQLFFDKVTGITFKSDKQWLEAQTYNVFNPLLLRRQDIQLIELYEMWGLRLPVMPAVAYAFGFSIRKDKYGKELSMSSDDMLVKLRFKPILLDSGETVTVIAYDVKPNFDSYLSSDDDVWQRLADYNW